MPIPATCNTTTTAAVCNYDQFKAHDIQESLEVQLLYDLLVHLDGTQAGKSFAQLLTDSGAFACQSTGSNRLIQANTIAKGLAAFNPPANPQALHCFRPQEVAAIKSLLICKLVSALNT